MRLELIRELRGIQPLAFEQLLDPLGQALLGRAGLCPRLALILLADRGDQAIQERGLNPSKRFKEAPFKGPPLSDSSIRKSPSRV